MLVLAHRGVYCRGVSENTIEAFEEGIRQGADGIEFDLRVSKDGELVVVHDANLHRIAGDAHKVSEFTAAELAQIPLRHGGRILTLHDVTSQIHAPAILDMELKHRDALEPLITKLKTSATLRERTILSSFHASALLRLRRELPDVRTLFLVKRWPLPLGGKRFLKRLERLHPRGVAFPLPTITRQRIQLLKRHGLQVGAWDLRGTAREARHARSLGLDFAIVRNVREAKSFL